MNELIKYFNKIYGAEYGDIEYPRTNIQMYQAYQVIKDLELKDEQLNELLDESILPKPKTLKEREMYSECINDNSNNNEHGNEKETLFIPLSKFKTYDAGAYQFSYYEFSDKEIELLKKGGLLYCIDYYEVENNEDIYYEEPVSILMLNKNRKVFSTNMCTIVLTDPNNATSGFLENIGILEHENITHPFIVFHDTDHFYNLYFESNPILSDLPF